MHFVGKERSIISIISKSRDEATQIEGLSANKLRSVRVAPPLHYPELEFICSNISTKHLPLVLWPANHGHFQFDYYLPHAHVGCDTYPSDHVGH